MISAVAQEMTPKQQHLVSKKYNKRKLTGLSQTIGSTSPLEVELSGVLKKALQTVATERNKERQPTEEAKRFVQPKAKTKAEQPPKKKVSAKKVKDTREERKVFKSVKTLAFAKRIKQNLAVPPRMYLEGREATKKQKKQWQNDPYNRSFAEALADYESTRSEMLIEDELKQSDVVVYPMVSDLRSTAKAKAVTTASGKRKKLMPKTAVERTVSLNQALELATPVKSRLYSVSNASEDWVGYTEISRQFVTIGDLVLTLGKDYTATQRFIPSQYDWSKARARGEAAQKTYRFKNRIPDELVSKKIEPFKQPVVEVATDKDPVTHTEDLPPWELNLEYNPESTCVKTYHSCNDYPGVVSIDNPDLSEDLVLSPEEAPYEAFSDVDYELMLCFQALRRETALKNHFKTSTLEKLNAKYGMSVVEWKTARRHRKADYNPSPAKPNMSPEMLEKLRFKQNQKFRREQNHQYAKDYHMRYYHKQHPDLQAWFASRLPTKETDPHVSQQRLLECLASAEELNPSVQYDDSRYWFADAYRYEKACRQMDYENLFAILDGDIADNSDPKLTIRADKVPVPVGEPYGPSEFQAPPVEREPPPVVEAGKAGPLIPSLLNEEVKVVPFRDAPRFERPAWKKKWGDFVLGLFMLTFASRGGNTNMTA